jgi:protease-4
MRPWALVAFSLVLSLGCGRPRHESASKSNELGPKDRRIVEIDLSNGAPESAKAGLFQLPAGRTYTGLVRTLEDARSDPLTAGLWVRLGGQSIDFARAEELGRLLGAVRDKGVPVVCHAHTLTNASSLLVSRGCSKIWLSFGGSVDSVGIAAEVVHLKGLLDKLKIGVDFLAVGKFKSGAEPLTREEPSANAREALASTLGSIRDSWLTAADSGRPGRELKQKLEQGPYSPEEAKAAGIIDAVGFESQALGEAKQLAKTEHVQSGFGEGAKTGGGFSVSEVIRVLAGGEDDSKGTPHISVVPAEGAISMDSGGPLDSSGITAKALTRTLKRIAKDDSIKAVVLRIDSPGGSPLASDLIWHELVELRKKKPVIASVGSMAASGGYYIACGAQRIIAERTSIVGSIGVFGGKIVLGPALHEFGVNAFAIAANPDPAAAARAAYLSPFQPWDDATRTRVRAHMQSIYDLFISRVAESRKIPDAQIRENAEGRIWSGVQGQERGLVDELGGLATAIAAARKLTGLAADAPVTIEGPRDGILEMLFSSDDASASASEGELKAAVARFEREHALLEALPPALRMSGAALGPLARGETAVAALPFALILH